MKNLKSLFTDSFHELKNVRTIAMTAMLLAVAVVLGFYTLQLTDYIKIGFVYIANELTGMMFGPVVGALMGGLADVVKYIVNPTGPFFPGFTISGVLGGLIYGCVLYKRPLSLKRIILANVLVMVLVNILVNTYWLTLLYGSAYMALLPVRILKQVIMLPIEVVFILCSCKSVDKSAGACKPD